MVIWLTRFPGVQVAPQGSMPALLPPLQNLFANYLYGEGNVRARPTPLSSRLVSPCLSLRHDAAPNQILPVDEVRQVLSALYSKMGRFQVSLRCQDSRRGCPRSLILVSSSDG